MYLNSSTKKLKNQMEILSDKNTKGQERPWRENKLKTLLLAESYARLGLRKSYRVRECGSYLQFKQFRDDTSKLNGANFCKVRLCPMCAWRRSLKIFSQVSKVMDKALEIKDYRFLFLTLTCKNVYGEDLSKTIDNLFYGFKKLMLKTNVKKAVKGWFRALEVTHNLDVKSKDYDTYHPHFHVILMVNKSYFTDTKFYLSQKDWTNLWQDSLQADYIPVVNIKAFKTAGKKQMSKSVAESAKYTVKDNDFLIPGNEEMTDSAVMILDKALANRRLVAFGGELRKIHKALNLDDMEKGDLINTGDDEEIRDDLDYMIVHYFWHVGYNQYYKSNLK